MNLYLYIFISGLLIGFSLCTFSCGILIFPVSGIKSINWKNGLGKGTLFISGKLISYGFYGSVASFSHFLLQSFLNSKYPFILGGTGLIIYGIFLYFFGERKCSNLKFNLPIFFVGLIYGFLPCGPLIGFLFYLAYISKGVLFGFIAGILYGIGTSISPLIISIFSPFFWEKISISKFRFVLKFLPSLIFISFGLNLLVKVL